MSVKRKFVIVSVLSSCWLTWSHSYWQDGSSTQSLMMLTCSSVLDCLHFHSIKMTMLMTAAADGCFASCLMCWHFMQRLRSARRRERLAPTVRWLPFITIRSHLSRSEPHHTLVSLHVHVVCSSIVEIGQTMLTKYDMSYLLFLVWCDIVM